MEMMAGMNMMSGAGMVDPNNPMSNPTQGHSSCELACHSDGCTGTKTNDIPDGQTWTTTYPSIIDWGCCTLWSQACDYCCPPTEANVIPQFQNNCEYACGSDNCMGTLTNSIPHGMQWTIVKQDATDHGCCLAGLSSCDLCCEPVGAAAAVGTEEENQERKLENKFKVTETHFGRNKIKEETEAPIPEPREIPDSPFKENEARILESNGEVQEISSEESQERKQEELSNNLEIHEDLTTKFEDDILHEI